MHYKTAQTSLAELTRKPERKNSLVLLKICPQFGFLPANTTFQLE